MQELAVLASRALTAQRQFTAIADNVANANTHGFKRLDLDFKEMVSRPRAHATASYTADRSIRMDFANGAFEQTGNPLDMAIAGDGFFAVQTAQGVQYTRQGQFLLNQEGTLVTPEGNPVLDAANAPIQFPQDVKSVKVANDGTISTEQGILAQVGVFNFPREQMGLLQRAGNTDFVPRNGLTATPMETPVVRQGVIENSNVNGISEMVNMQAVSRAYQNTLRTMKGLEDLESRAIRNLGGTQ